MECLPREELVNLQLRRLQENLARVYENSPMYRNRLDQVGFKPHDLKSLADLSKIPFTTKDDFRDNYPFGMFVVPMQQIVRLHASSGTTGKLTVIGCTKNDLENWAEMIARVVCMAGVTSDDICQIAFGYGLFTGAHGLHYGLEKVGSTVIPISGGNSEKQLMLMKDFGTTVLVSTPTYALHLAEVAMTAGIDPSKDLNVKIGLFGGEAFSEEYRQELSKRWGMLATDNYGLSEVGGPGLSGECEYLNGQHIAEDHFLVEIVDPVTFEPLPPGVKGEVVITTLTKEALPVIRYRAKDISSITYEPCACGRTTARLSKITGRTDDMLVIRGINVFPSQIESVLMNIEGLEPHYQIILYKKGYLDDLEINVEVSDDAFSDRYKHLEELEQKLKYQLHKILSLNPKVKLVEPRSLERTEGKAKRIIDLRNK